jgi:mono/diheme cytochrome c family protein
VFPSTRLLLLGGALALLLASCGYDWRTDMWFQPSHRPQSLGRIEPERSVPYGLGHRYFDRDDAEAIASAVTHDAETVKRGAWLFAERCACCHGDEGHGGGPVSKFFPPAPDLAYTTVRTRSDAFLWGTITFGGRAMPAQVEGLSTGDRWDLVSFIRDLQARTPVGAKP